MRDRFVEILAVTLALTLAATVGVLYTMVVSTCWRRWGAAGLLAAWLACSAGGVAFFFWRAWHGGAYAHNSPHYHRVVLPWIAFVTASAFAIASLLAARRSRAGQPTGRRTMWLGAAGFIATLFLASLLLSGLDRLTCARRLLRAPTGEVVTECEMYRQLRHRP
jgi:hypothetical protein